FTSAWFERQYACIAAFGFNHHASGVLAIIKIDQFAVFLRVRKLIAPAARCLIVGIDDALHIIFVVSASLAATGPIRARCRTQFRPVILRQIGRDRGGVDRDGAVRQNAADDLAALVTKDIVLQLSGEGTSSAVWIVVSEMRCALVAIPRVPN